MIATATPAGVPELDPTTGSSALSLLAGVLAMVEQRQRGCCAPGTSSMTWSRLLSTACELAVEKVLRDFFQV